MNERLTIDLGLGHVRLDQPQGSHFHVGSEYGPAEGFYTLREAIARWEKVSVDNIAVTTGASLGLVSALAFLGSPGSVLCPRPFYPAYPKVIQMLGLEAVYYDLKKQNGQADPECIRDLIREDTRALLLNFPSNPTGTLPSVDALAQIGEAIQGANLVVISDEVYSDFIYDDYCFPNIPSVIKQAPVIRLRSFSKLFGMPGERLGYVVADPFYSKLISKAHWSLAMCPPASAQSMALTFLNSTPDVKINDLRHTLLGTRDQVSDILKTCDNVDFDLPQAGIFFWIQVPRGAIDSRTLAQKCAEMAGVIVVPGAVFGVECPTYLRASFAVPLSEALYGFSGLVNLLKTLKGKC